MATYRHWSVSLWQDPDDVSHCRIMSPEKTKWWLILATLCGWRRCFVADQLWLIKRIREEEVRCMFDRFSTSDFGGKWPIKIFENVFRIPWQDTKVGLVTKFGENRPLQSCWKVVWLAKQKNSHSAGFVPAPILPKMGQSHPKFSERCHPLPCPRILNLVQIGCVLPNLFRKDWFFGPKSQYNIGFQPTIIIICIALLGAKIQRCLK